MMRALIIIVMFGFGAYILGFTNELPSFNVDNDMSVPDMMRTAGSYNPHSISPKKLEELSKVPLSISPAEMEKRGKKVQNRLFNKIADATEGISIGKMINSIQKTPAMLMKLMKFGDKAMAMDDPTASGVVMME
ncbi:MAG: hypothetical protein ACTSXQ_04580 [Alphaproteobacteria bacterium]